MRRPYVTIGKPKIALVLSVLLLMVVFGLSACDTSETPPTETPTTTPAETSTGTIIHQTLATGDVGVNEYSSTAPGSSQILPRDYPGAPPHIPHDISGLKIDKDENSCVTCHAQGISFGEGHTATKIPESHYIDIPSGTQSQDLQGLRYNCRLCHLPQSSEEPPVK